MTLIEPKEADVLNESIKKSSLPVYQLLSKRGREIYFPRQGILAQGLEAEGKEINATLGIAYEDDGVPMVLPSIAQKLEIKAAQAFPYAPSPGLPLLRDKWIEWMHKKNSTLQGKPISKPVVSCALTHGLSMAGYMFADEGDEIIVANLYWENYDLVFTNTYGAKLKKFNFFEDDKFDINSFKTAIAQNGIGKKIILLNFPNNPSGYTPTIEATQQIKQALYEAAENGNHIVVLLDDAYFGLSFADDIPRESIFVHLADLHPNLLALKIDGITKEDYAWGFRVGFLTYGIKNGSKELYKALEEKTAGAVRGTISNAPHLSQSLILNALESGTYEEEKRRNAAKIKERYVKVKEILAAHKEYSKYFKPLPFNSGYFMCIKLRENLDPEAVRKHLLAKYNTGLILINNLLRITFAAVAAEKMEKLFSNIFNACRDLSS